MVREPMGNPCRNADNDVVAPGSAEENQHRDQRKADFDSPGHSRAHGASTAPTPRARRRCHASTLCSGCDNPHDQLIHTGTTKLFE
jgi:hypothetical protein